MSSEISSEAVSIPPRYHIVLHPLGVRLISCRQLCGRVEEDKDLLHFKLIKLSASM